MNLPLFLARRMARATSQNHPGIMERIAVISVGLGVAVMILAIAVILGFKREVSATLSAIAAPVVVCDVAAVQSPDAAAIVRSDEVEELIRSTAGFRSVAPFVVKGGIVRTDEAVAEVLLKGVDVHYDWSQMQRWLIAGELPRVGDSIRTKDVLISQTLARKIRLAVGDRIEMLFVDSGTSPRRDRFKVSGIYATGMEEMESPIVVTDLRNVQRLAEWSADQISGYEVYPERLDEMEAFADRLETKLLFDDSSASDNLVVTSLAERYPNVFDWLRAHDVNAVVILVIMLLVAFFNMTSALLILVLERTKTIGLLKALGMTNGAVRRLFLWRAAFITLRGLAWGNGVGLLLCLLQGRFHWVKLASEGYLLSEVPVAFDAGWWLLLNAGFVAAIVGLLILPTYIISTVKPDETIRYES